MDGYRQVLPLSLSPTELMALVFSRDLLKPLDGTELKASLDSALNKAAATLPAEGTRYIERLRGHFSVGVGAHKPYREHRQTIDQLSQAIAQTRTVQMRYYTASRDRTARREVDPYHLWYADGGLYLIGHCHLRQDVRMFAVDRIRSLALTNRPCQMPLDFDLDAYVKDALVVMRGTPIEIELLFDKPTTAWVKGPSVASQPEDHPRKGWPPAPVATRCRHPRAGWLGVALRQRGAGHQPGLVQGPSPGRSPKNSCPAVTPDVTPVCYTRCKFTYPAAPPGSLSPGGLRTRPLVGARRTPPFFGLWGRASRALRP